MGGSVGTITPGVTEQYTRPTDPPSPNGNSSEVARLAPSTHPPTMTGGGPSSDVELAADSAQMTSGQMKLTWLNIRGARSKDELLVRKATEQQWPLVLLTETKLKREYEKLYCGENQEYSWILGTGLGPSRDREPGKGGVGALIHASIRGLVHKLEATREQLWLRLDDKRHTPVFIGVVYLPSGSHTSARTECTRIYEELAVRVQKYQSQGTVLLGGDMNARIAANGDKVTNTAGLQMIRFCQRNGLMIANTELPARDDQARCTGSFSRVELHSDGLQQSTVDYVLVSKISQANVTSLSLEESVSHRILSDHKPLVLNWKWQPARSSHQPAELPRVRWRVDDICADRKVKARMQAGMNTAMSSWCQEANEWISSKQYGGISAESKVTSLLASWEYQLNRTLADTIGAKQVQQRAQSWVKGGDLLQLIRERDQLRERCEQQAKARSVTRASTPGGGTDDTSVSGNYSQLKPCTLSGRFGRRFIGASDCSENRPSQLWSENGVIRSSSTCASIRCAPTVPAVSALQSYGVRRVSSVVISSRVWRSLGGTTRNSVQMSDRSTAACQSQKSTSKGKKSSTVSSLSRSSGALHSW